MFSKNHASIFTLFFMLFFFVVFTNCTIVSKQTSIAFTIFFFTFFSSIFFFSSIWKIFSFDQFFAFSIQNEKKNNYMQNALRYMIDKKQIRINEHASKSNALIEFHDIDDYVSKSKKKWKNWRNREKIWKTRRKNTLIIYFNNSWR